LIRHELSVNVGRASARHVGLKADLQSGIKCAGSIVQYRSLELPISKLPQLSRRLMSRLGKAQRAQPTTAEAACLSACNMAQLK